MRPLDPMLRHRLTFPLNVVSWLIGVSSCWLLAGLLRSRFSLPRLRLLLPRSVLVVLPSLPSRGVTLDISLIVISHVSVIGSLAYGVCKTFRVLVTPCWLHRQLRRCT